MGTLPPNVIEAGFACARVKGGWRLYDTRKRVHFGRTFRHRTSVEARLRQLSDYSPELIRWILAGEISPKWRKVV